MRWVKVKPSMPGMVTSTTMAFGDFQVELLNSSSAARRGAYDEPGFLQVDAHEPQYTRVVIYHKYGLFGLHDSCFSPGARLWR